MPPTAAWAPSASDVKGNAGDVPPGATLTFKGSCQYEVIGTGNPVATGYQIG